jgi:hypothetical protein
MRKSTVFFSLIALNIVLLVLAFTHASRQRSADEPALQRRAGLVERLGLTDLCLFTEARYTRHPSQADLHTPFQDHPLSLEHFPSGSLLPPPGALREAYAGLD